MGLTMSYLRKIGVICFCETWGKKISDFDDFLLGYKHYGNLRKQSNLMRNSGGVSLFIHDEIIKTGTIKQLYTYFKDCTVIILKGDYFLDGKDIIMYFAYVSPEGSPIYEKLGEKDGIRLIHENFNIIYNDYANANYFLGGDLNAKTRDFLEYIPSDDPTFFFGETSYDADTFEFTRNNKDSLRFNAFGKTLVEFCCSNSMHIINGRLSMDTDGNFTCVTNNGASTVDYNICSTLIFDQSINQSILYSLCSFYRKQEVNVHETQFQRGIDIIHNVRERERDRQTDRMRGKRKLCSSWN